MTVCVHVSGLGCVEGFTSSWKTQPQAEPPGRTGGGGSPRREAGGGQGRQQCGQNQEARGHQVWGSENRAEESLVGVPGLIWEGAGEPWKVVGRDKTSQIRTTARCQHPATYRHTPSHEACVSRWFKSRSHHYVRRTPSPCLHGPLRGAWWREEAPTGQRLFHASGARSAAPPRAQVGTPRHPCREKPGPSQDGDPWPPP